MNTTPARLPSPPRSGRPARPGYRPRLEALECRLAPALVPIVEDFFSHSDPTALHAGFDTDDTASTNPVRVGNDRPAAQEIGPYEGGIPPGGFYIIDTTHPATPADSPYLELMSITGAGSISFFPLPAGTPGGLSPGQAALGAGLQARGQGVVTFVGTTGSKTVNVDTGGAWLTQANAVFATYQDAADGGGTLGPIQKVVLTTVPSAMAGQPGPEFDVDNIGFALGANPNQPPPPANAVADHAVVAKGKKVTIDVLANDPPGLTIQSFTKPRHGTVTEVHGKLRYKPNTSYNGHDHFSYTAVDANGHTSTARVDIAFPDHTPINHVPRQVQVSKGVFEFTKREKVSVEDPTGGDPRLVVTLKTGAGILNVGNSHPGVTVAGEGTGTLVLRGRLRAVNRALARLEFTADTERSGKFGLTMKTIDLEGSPVQTATDTITLLLPRK